jgi:hypothetical protein
MREVMERKTDEIRALPKTKIKQATPCLISQSLCVPGIDGRRGYEERG